MANSGLYRNRIEPDREKAKAKASARQMTAVYAAERMALYYAIGLVFQLVQKNQHTSGSNRELATIVSDNMSIANAWKKSGQ
ncbi:hypothetical protein EYZ11_006236 [Aspergillus tanneri]|uniref:Uncharacterized protein n=1 Tax=Aspergillus tanneri TaxID=1220188 RepID=A0A4S3JGE6_9EURO|nr:hypothetical protein EYZ11_006236 [Aspergillus tanneri]